MHHQESPAKKGLGLRQTPYARPNITKRYAAATLAKHSVRIVRDDGALEVGTI